MFEVLAIGTLMDAKLPPFSLEAEKYNMLARAALFQNAVFNEPTIGTVQALVRCLVDLPSVCSL